MGLTWCIRVESVVATADAGAAVEQGVNTVHTAAVVSTGSAAFAFAFAAALWIVDSTVSPCWHQTLLLVGQMQWTQLQVHTQVVVGQMGPLLARWV